MAELGVDALFINSQSDGTATNYPQYGMWAGLLATLKPGVGYLLSMDADVTFYYPEFDGLARLRENKQEVILSEKISNWDFNYADYEFIGTITASIESHEDSDGDIVSIFVDDECRGIAERTYFSLDNTYYYIIQVYSNITEGEDMTFKYYDSQNDEVIEYSEMLTFTNNMIVGDGFNTFSLSRIAPSEFLLSQAYPNPFNPTTTVSFAIPVTSNVILEAYDIKGRLI